MIIKNYYIITIITVYLTNWLWVIIGFGSISYQLSMDNSVDINNFEYFFSERNDDGMCFNTSSMFSVVSFI